MPVKEVQYDPESTLTRKGNQLLNAELVILRRTKQ
jgi:anthranilate/para-aminobenzoate synthase component II